MRVTVAHNKTKAEATKAVNDAADRIFREDFPGPLKISNAHRAWSGDQLNFSLNASLMGMSSAIKGYILVTDHDITIDADLPALLTMLFPEKKIAAETEKRVRGLLT
jgi:hypothetical protein